MSPALRIANDLAGYLGAAVAVATILISWVMP